jgi:hypothetical protein
MRPMVVEPSDADGPMRDRTAREFATTPPVGRVLGQTVRISDADGSRSADSAALEMS